MRAKHIFNLLNNPTWGTVLKHFDRAIEVTGDYHHCFLEGIGKPTGRSSEQTCQRVAKSMSFILGADMFYVFTVIDGIGDTHRTVCQETSDTIFIECYLHNDGGAVYFESDAYHLEDWCKENGFAYSKQKYTFDDLGNPAKVS